MKLKKIASLALAGVMAVSMLAGCSNTSNNGNNGNNGGDPIDPGTAGVSAAVATRVADVLDPKEIPEYVSFKDSTALDSNLEYAVEFAGVTNVLPQYVLFDKLTPVMPDIYDRLHDAVGDEYDGVKIWNIGDVDTLQKAENEDGYKIDDEVAVELWAVSSAIGENAVNQMIAEKIAETVADYQYAINNTNNDKTDGGNYNHEYTVSVSTYTKTVNSSSIGGGIGVDVTPYGIGGVDVDFGVSAGVGAEKPAVTFVAVQVVRTSTHQ